LDGSPLCIPENGGELIVPHPMFRFTATANTNGGGDETGLYQGTQRQNIAWLDRFMLCELSYPKSEVEKSLLAKLFPVLPEELCAKLVDFAGEVRAQFMGDKEGQGLSGAIEVTLSTRTLLRWAELTVRFQPLAREGIPPVPYALDRALAYRACRETRAMLHELAQRIFPQECRLGEFQEGDSPPPMPDESDDATYIVTTLRASANMRPYIALEYMHSSNTGKFWRGTRVADQGHSVLDKT
jgi:cobaltochelatase CobS